MPHVVAVVVSYHRLALLRRLLVSLRDQGPALARVVIVDNGGEVDAAEVGAVVGGPVEVVRPGENLGTAGGVARGFAVALSEAATTHVWVLDDDAVAGPGALTAMVAAQEAAGAGAVTPLVVDAGGRVAWFPGPLAEPAWGAVRRGVTPAEFRQACGDRVWAWIWATWASLLLTREVVATVGGPRVDLWFQGTDTEYTLRVSQRFRCVLAPGAECAHLPADETAEGRRLKEGWALQNNAFVATRLRHGWRVLRHLPGNHWRYWRRHGSAGASWGAFWRGAILGRPVGPEAYAAARRKAG